MVFHTYILNNSFSHAGYSNLYEWLCIELWTHARNYMSTTIYTKTSQVTVGQLHCFEMIPLGTFSTFDAPDLCTLHLVTAGNRFPSKRLNFKLLHSEPSNTFVEKHLRRDTPSTSKATNFSLGRNLLSILPSFDGHFDKLSQSKASFSF